MLTRLHIWDFFFPVFFLSREAERVPEGLREPL